jgi:hypothetical protein
VARPDHGNPRSRRQAPDIGDSARVTM